MNHVDALYHCLLMFVCLTSGSSPRQHSPPLLVLSVCSLCIQREVKREHSCSLHKHEQKNRVAVYFVMVMCTSVHSSLRWKRCQTPLPNSILYLNCGPCTSVSFNYLHRLFFHYNVVIRLHVYMHYIIIVNRTGYWPTETMPRTLPQSQPFLRI